MNTDHDKLFKALLSEFFLEFVDAFLPDMSAYLDHASLIPMPQEVLTDITAGERKTVDLLFKGKFKDEEAFFLIHVENQSSDESDFGKRMFLYFARLFEKYQLPIYPIVLFSYDMPLRPEPTRYTVAFQDKTVLQFEYTTIQLNRLSWRAFLQQPNPVANALMTKMKIADKDRPKVKVECARMLATLQLNPAQSALIWTFVETYLELNAKEERTYQTELESLEVKEKERVMELMSPGERKGRQEGRQEALENILARQIAKKFGAVLPEITARLDQMNPDQMNELGEALFDFTSVADLENWFSHHLPQ